MCYKSGESRTPEERDAFIRRLIAAKHDAMLEHVSITIHMVTDRGISHELVRHRLASYAQESTRYCNYSKDRFGREISVVQPSGLTPEQRDTWYKACLDAEHRYFCLLDSGATPQMARSVLPTCLKTEIVMTANVREWRHFLRLRYFGTTGAPHPDMKKLAGCVFAELEDSAVGLCFEDSP